MGGEWCELDSLYVAWYYDAVYKGVYMTERGTNENVCTGSRPGLGQNVWVWVVEWNKKGI